MLSRLQEYPNTTLYRSPGRGSDNNFVFGKTRRLIFNYGVTNGLSAYTLNPGDTISYNPRPIKLQMNFFPCEECRLVRPHINPIHTPGPR